MKDNRLRIAYISADLLFSAAAWLIFYFYRKLFIEKEIYGSYLEISADKNLYAGLVAVPLFWFLLFYIYGLYNSPSRRSRLKELGDSLLLTLTGSIILFFTLLLDDTIAGYANYYHSFLVLLSLQFILTWLPRFLITTRTQSLIRKGKRGFNTIIIGSNGKAVEVYRRITGQKQLTGNIITGFIEAGDNNPGESPARERSIGESTFGESPARERSIGESPAAERHSGESPVRESINGDPAEKSEGSIRGGRNHRYGISDRVTTRSATNGGTSPLGVFLPCLGNLNDLDAIMKSSKPDEIIIATEDSESHTTGTILNRLWRYDTVIKSIPGMYDVLLGKVRLSSIFGTPLLLLSYNPMPFWQQNIKRVLDILLSLTALTVTLPLTLALAAAIRAGSSGPVIYRQERIGRRGKPFMIFKLRSMINNAEEDGPLLSSTDDPRITATGRFMRRHRLDEIPNFINVLRGEMSLVGPRPERKFFIDLITKDTPEYLQLLKVRPGITSWGQVLYGYASTVDEMKERMSYDLLYLKNLSLYVDFKIIIYTVITVLRGRGI
jgi:exopolysaccharide biosynthesis polyprenyl glycosylphosphotransferase